MDLHPITIELDFVDPGEIWTAPSRSKDAKAGSTKPGRGALTPISVVFLR
jgi:hypothetical protein